MQDVLKTLDFTAKLAARFDTMAIALRRGKVAEFNRAMQDLEILIWLERGIALNTLEAMEAVHGTVPDESVTDATWQHRTAA
jgi:hypothetical protein